MRALLQRVSHASVKVDEEVVGEIEQGILVFLGVQQGDTEKVADKLFDKIVNYRIFSDAEGKMNLSVKDINGGLLIVSQFTLAADTKKGLRPGFSLAAKPDRAQALYNYCLDRARLLSVSSDAELLNTGVGYTVEAGIFGADMKVSLINDGPVTFILEASSD